MPLIAIGDILRQLVYFSNNMNKPYQVCNIFVIYVLKFQTCLVYVFECRYTGTLIQKICSVFGPCTIEGVNLQIFITMLCSN